MRAPQLRLGRISGSRPPPLTRDGQGNFVALVAVTNAGNVTITSAQVTTAGTSLGAAALLSPPPPIKNLAPGASAVITLAFPSTATLSGATTASLRVSGEYSAPVVSLSGRWALRFRRVSLK
jgi:hypothetical protein